MAQTSSIVLCALVAWNWQPLGLCARAVVQSQPAVLNPKPALPRASADRQADDANNLLRAPGSLQFNLHLLSVVQYAVVSVLPIDIIVKNGAIPREPWAIVSTTGKVLETISSKQRPRHTWALLLDRLRFC